MKTSCFRNYTGNDGVSICLRPPHDWTGACYTRLAPDRDSFYAAKAGKMSDQEYEEAYRKNVLSKLDAAEIYGMLRDSVLLCWEEPGAFCHRRVLARWIEEEIGIGVPEWQPSDETKKTGANPLF